MRRLFLLLALLPACVLLMGLKPNMLVNFTSSDWDKAKLQASQENKLYFVDFDASYCATCRNMDESTYTDASLAYYMRQNVVANRLDVQDFDGVMWSQRYDIEALPTMLIFDTKGKLVKRIVGYKSASDLIRLFKEVKGEVNPYSTPDDPLTEEPMADNSTVVPEPSPNNTPSDPNVNIAPNIFVSDEKAVLEPSGSGLYEVAVKKQESKGFAIQVGVYGSYETVLRQTEQIRKDFSQRTLVHVDQMNGSTVYKLLLGTFKTRREAANFRSLLKQKKREGIIKDLRLMQ